jgi:hypothetical protein
LGRFWDAAITRTLPPRRETRDTVPAVNVVKKTESAVTAMYISSLCPLATSGVKQRAPEHPAGQVFEQLPQWFLSV